MTSTEELGSGWRSGGPTGLQNQLAELNPRLVGSIPTRSRHLLMCLICGSVLFTGELFGQNSPPVEGARIVDTEYLEQDRISARGAFIRSLLIPGWGQSAAGSPGRGAFYFGIEGASLWMVLKTARNLGGARRRLETLETGARLKFTSTEGLKGTALDQAVANDPDVRAAATLIEDRLEQREDWIAVSLFFLLFGAADAFVTAHLQHFPEPLDTKIEANLERGVGVSFTMPISLFR